MTSVPPEPAPDTSSANLHGSVAQVQKLSLTDKAPMTGDQVKLKGVEDGVHAEEETRGGLQKMAQENAENSPLLRIAAELRNQIWRYALGDLHVTPKKSILPEENGLGLLRTCRQIHEETSSLVYEVATFETISEGHLMTWTSDPFPYRLDSIQILKTDPSSFWQVAYEDMPPFSLTFPSLKLIFAAIRTASTEEEAALNDQLEDWEINVIAKLKSVEHNDDLKVIPVWVGHGPVKSHPNL